MSLSNLRPMPTYSYSDIKRKKSGYYYQQKPTDIPKDTETSEVTVLASEQFGDVRIIIEENEIYVVCLDIGRAFGFIEYNTATSYFRNHFDTTYRYIDVTYEVDGVSRTRRQKTIVTPFENVISSVESVEQHIKGKNGKRVAEVMTPYYKRAFLVWFDKAIKAEVKERGVVNE